MSNKNKIVDIIENAIDDFGYKWSSHTEKSEGISEYADQILQLEIPGRESELIRMLEEIVYQFDWKDENDSLQQFSIDKAKNLIQSVKSERYK